MNSSEDYILSTNLTENEAKNKLFTAIKSAAESGWDFSSRHVRGKDNSNEGTWYSLRFFVRFKITQVIIFARRKINEKKIPINNVPQALYWIWTLSLSFMSI